MTVELQIRVDRALGNTMSGLEEIHRGLTDPDGNWAWDDWDAEAKAAFIRRHAPDADFDLAEDDSLDDALNSFVITPNLPTNVVRREFEAWLIETEGEADPELLKSIAPVQEVDNDSRLQIWRGVLRVDELKEVGFTGVSIETTHLPDWYTAGGSREHGGQMAAYALDLYRMAELEKRAGELEKAIDLLPPDEQVRASAMLAEIEGGDGNRVGDLQALLRSAAENPQFGISSDAMDAAVEALEETEGGDSLTWNDDLDYAFNREQDEFSEAWDDTNPDIESVSKLEARGPEIGSVIYQRSWRDTAFENTQQAREMALRHSAALRANSEADANRQRHADLMAKPESERTARDWAEIRSIESWAATDADGDGVADHTLDWVSAEVLAVYDPLDPAYSGPIPPADQLNQVQRRADLIGDQNREEVESRDVYEYGSQTGFHRGGEAARNTLFPDLPELDETGNEAFWALQQGIVAAVQDIARTDPDLAEQIAGMWADNPDGALHLVSDFETTWGRSVMDQSTRDGLELRALTPAYGLQDPSDSVADYTAAVLLKTAVLEGVPVQRSINEHLEGLSQLLVDLSNTPYDAGTAPDVVARIVARLGETGHGNRADVFLNVDGRWHVRPGASGDAADLATVMNDLATDIALLKTHLGQAAQWFDAGGGDPALAARLRGYENAADILVDLNFRQVGAGISGDAALEFVQSVQNGERYDAGPPLDMDHYLNLMRAAGDARQQTVINDVVWPLIQQITEQAETLDLDPNDPESVMRFLNEMLEENPHLLGDDGTTFTGGTAGNLLLNALSPEYAASEKAIAHYDAEWAAGRITRAEHQELVESVRTLQQTLLRNHPWPPGVRTFFESQIGGSRSEIAQGLVGNMDETPPDTPEAWMAKYGDLYGVGNLAAETGLSEQEIIGLMVQAGLDLSKTYFSHRDDAVTWVAAAEGSGNTFRFVSLLGQKMREVGAGILNPLLKQKLLGLTMANLSVLLGMTALVVVDFDGTGQGVAVMAPDFGDTVLMFEEARVAVQHHCDSLSEVSMSFAGSECDKAMAAYLRLRENHRRFLEGKHDIGIGGSGSGVPDTGEPPPDIVTPPVAFLTGTAKCGSEQGDMKVDLEGLDPDSLPEINQVRTNVQDIFWTFDEVPGSEQLASGTRVAQWWTHKSDLGSEPPWLAFCEDLARTYTFFKEQDISPAEFDTSSATHICRQGDNCVSAQTAWDDVLDIPVVNFHFALVKLEEDEDEVGNTLGWLMQATCTPQKKSLRATHAVHTLWDAGNIDRFHSTIADRTHPGTRPVGTTDWCLDMKGSGDRWQDYKWGAEVAGQYDHDARIVYETTNRVKPGAPQPPLPILVSETDDLIGVHLIRAANVPERD